VSQLEVESMSFELCEEFDKLNHFKEGKFVTPQNFKFWNVAKIP
jgi:hypothetical protein